MKRPASQWYWADWLRAPEIRGISLESRGFWMDLLAITHEGTPYGHLAINGKAIDDKTLARMVGTTPQKVRKLLAELESHNVFSRTELGVIYSRRMVRDERLRNVRRESGLLGGNPNLIVAGKDNQGVNQGTGDKDNLRVKVEPTPSSSSSSSSSVTTTPSPEIEAISDCFPNSEAAKAMLVGMTQGLGTPGMKAVAVEVLTEAMGELRTSGGEITPHRFKAFVRKVLDRQSRESEPSRNGAIRGKGSTTRALKLIGLIRNRRNPMHPNSVLPEWKEGLEESEAEVCRSFGLTRILNDQNEGTVVAQLARALEESVA